MKTPLNFVLSCYLVPLLISAKSRGVNVDRHVAATSLGIVDLGRTDISIPQTAANRLFTKIAAEGGDSMPTELLEEYSIRWIPGWGDAIAAVADLRAALDFAASPEARLVSGNRVIVRTNGRMVTLIDRYVPRLAADEQWIAVSSFFLIYNDLREICGNDWRPQLIEVPFDNVSALERSQDLSDVTIRTGQTETRLHFDISALGCRMPGSAVGQADCPHVAASITHQIYSILDGLNPDVIPSFERFSTFLDVSKRTLQRRLDEDGTTYTKVFMNWRAAKAVDLLDDPRLQVKEIAARLHYRHPSHFIRAFKKATGVTPAEFRDAS